MNIEKMLLQDILHIFNEEIIREEQEKEEIEEKYRYLDFLYSNIKDEKLHIDDFIKNHNHINYCEAIIYRDGTIAYCRPSHIETLIRETGLTHSEIYNSIPIFENVLLWLLNKTGCICVWYGDYITPENRKLTLAQHITLKKLSESNIVNFNIRGDIYA